MTVVDRLLTEHFDALGLAGHGLRDGWETVLLTPRFTTSRHVVGLVHPAGAAAPTVVVKLPRQPGDVESVEREARVLRTLGSGHEGAVPRVLGLVRSGAQLALVETAVGGVPLDPARVAADLDGAVRIGRQFLAGLPTTTTASANGDWYQRCVTAPLQLLLDRVGGDPGIAELIDRTHRALAPLVDRSVPSVFEHGDLSHPNLLLGPDGVLHVLDWERAVPAGIPGHDLVFYLQYLAESAVDAYTPDEQVAVWDRWWGPGGRGRDLLRDELDRYGIGFDRPREWLLLCWARSAATLGHRLTEDSGRSTALAAVLQDRDVLLWRRALDAMGTTS